MKSNNLIHQQLSALSATLGKLLLQHKQILAVAESCTGGFLCKIVTDAPGSSQWFDCGFISYSNESKQQQLAVQEGTLKNHGAVSEEVAAEMAAGAIRHSRATIAVSITGIAGPGGGSTQKPVGTVYLAWAIKPVSGDIRLSSSKMLLKNTRDDIRAESVKIALEGLIKIVQNLP